jgi:hypothetical protein
MEGLSTTSLFFLSDQSGSIFNKEQIALVAAADPQQDLLFADAISPGFAEEIHPIAYFKIEILRFEEYDALCQTICNIHFTDIITIMIMTNLCNCRLKKWSRK